MVHYLPQKDPLESLPGIFDFSQDLQAGETITGVVSVTVTTVDGTDPTPSAILGGAAAVDSTGTKVSVPLVGGLDKVDYKIVVLATGSLSPDKYVRAMILPVRSF